MQYRNYSMTLCYRHSVGYLKQLTSSPVPLGSGQELTIKESGSLPCHYRNTTISAMEAIRDCLAPSGVDQMISGPGDGD